MTHSNTAVRKCEIEKLMVVPDASSSLKNWKKAELGKQEESIEKVGNEKEIDKDSDVLNSFLSQKNLIYKSKWVSDCVGIT